MSDAFHRTFSPTRIIQILDDLESAEQRGRQQAQAALDKAVADEREAILSYLGLEAYRTCYSNESAVIQRLISAIRSRGTEPKEG